MSKQEQHDWKATWTIEKVSLMTRLSKDELEGGKGPEVYNKKGGQIRFLRSDVEMWLEQHAEIKEDDEQ